MKMKKIVMGLVMALFAMNAMAANIKWWTKSTEENLVDLGSATTQLFAVDNGSSRAKSVSGAGDAVRGVEWPDNYILQISILGTELIQDRSGNVISTVSAWSSGKEIGIQVGVNEGGSIRWCDPTFDNEGYTDVPLCGGDDFWMNRGLQFQLGHPGDSQAVVVELGYYDEDYNFFAIASASDLFGNLGRYTYDQGTTDHPSMDWQPSPFTLYAVPEPSTAILALLGTCLLLKRRKNTHA